MKNSVVKILFGSHLYGTDTPKSDVDFKGIFLADPKDVCLGRIPKSVHPDGDDDTRKNNPGELDLEWLSLHHFVKLACQGQTMAIDMLFAPEQCVELGDHGEIWKELVDNRDKFLSKNMKAFVGYARGQAMKYSLKGDRLTKLREFVTALDDCVREDPIGHYWEGLPRDDERVGPHCKELQIAGKWFGETTSVRNVLDSVNRQIDRYGNRAAAAAAAGGVDWKAMSHAVRVSRELLDLLKNRKIVFPLPYAQTLLSIKLGKLDLYFVQGLIDDLLQEIETLMNASNLPETADNKWWDNWLYERVADQIYYERRP